MIGSQYGRLTVLAVSGNHARCRCRCGTEKAISLYQLTSGGTLSCGCLQRERSREANITHGGTYTAEYAIWRNLLSRCYNPKNKRYERYGGRGIRVFRAWKTDFSAFLDHVGRRPSPRHSLERIDNNGGYVPGNVRWATLKEQSRNRSSNRLLTYQGKTMTIVEWAEELGISANSISARLYKGWTEARALGTPLLR